MKGKTNRSGKLWGFIQASLVLFLLFSAISVSFGQKSSVQIFAHRGGGGEFDQNTLSAFEGSYAAGIRAFETDIRLTKDHHLVIFHDANLKRLGAQGRIEDKTLSEIRSLRTKEGHQIPTLEELLVFFNSKQGLTIEFELKTTNPRYNQDVLERYTEKVYKMVYANKPASSDYMFTSFDTRPLKYLKRKHPLAPLLLINNEGLSQAVLDRAKALGINRIGCRLDGTTKLAVENAKKQGFILSLGPTPTINDFLLGVALGADYVVPDLPVTMYNWVKKHGFWITLK